MAQFPLKQRLANFEARLNANEAFLRNLQGGMTGVFQSFDARLATSNELIAELITELTKANGEDASTFVKDFYTKKYTDNGYLESDITTDLKVLAGNVLLLKDPNSTLPFSVSVPAQSEFEGKLLSEIKELEGFSADILGLYTQGE